MAIYSLTILPVIFSLKLVTAFTQSFQQNFQACNIMKKLQLLSLTVMEDLLLCHLWALNQNSIISGKIHFAIYLQNQGVYKVKKVYRYA